MWYNMSTLWQSSCRQFFCYCILITSPNWHKCIYGVRDEIILVLLPVFCALHFARCLAIANLLYSLLWYTFVFRIDVKSSISSVADDRRLTRPGLKQQPSVRILTLFGLAYISCVLFSVFTNAGSSRWGRAFTSSPPFACSSVSPHVISKTAADKVTKREVEMFHDESWEPVYFGFKSSRSRVTETLRAWIFSLFF